MDKRRVHLLTVLGVTAVVALSLIVATQWAAHRAGHADQLGYEIAGGVYWPWAIVPWYLRYGEAYPRVFGPAMGVPAFAVVAVTLVLSLRRAWQRSARASVRPVGEGQWGDRADLGRAKLLGPAGTVVGRWRDDRGPAILTYNGPEHQLVSGATRSGKGVGHVIPTLLTWPDSVVVYDIKNELWDVTAGFRSTFGHALCFNPTKPDSVKYNPLFEVRRGANEIRDVQNIVRILVDPAGIKTQLDVWDQNASQFLVGLILHVLYTEPPEQKNLGRVRELLLDFDRACVAMMTTPHRRHATTNAPEVHPECARVAKALLSQAERFRSSVRGTAEGYLILYADEVVCANTSRSDFAIGDLMCLDRPMSLYLQPPPSDADRIKPLTRLMFSQFARALMEDQKHDTRGREKQHRLLLLMDEFPTLGRLEFFETNMGQMAGYGLKAHLVVQSFNDIAKSYGTHNTIIDNCHILTAFASADVLTQQRVSQMSGTAIEYRESYSRPRNILLGAVGGWSRHTVSQSEQVRPLLQPGDVRQLPEDEQLIFVTGYRPFRTPKLRYFEEDIFQGRLRSAPEPSRTTAAPDNPWRDERAKGPPRPLRTSALVEVPRDTLTGNLFEDDDAAAMAEVTDEQVLAADTPIAFDPPPPPPEDPSGVALESPDDQPLELPGSLEDSPGMAGDGLEESSEDLPGEDDRFAL